jgi:polyisoprenoid-binding protein YceI
MTTEANAARPTESSVVHYRVDPSQSRIAVQAFAEGLFSAFGHDPIFEVRDCSGAAQFTPDTFAAAAVKLTIKAESLTVTGDVKEKDRAEIERMMRDEVLETAKYPTISFTSSRVTLARLGEMRYRATIVGDLTLHGSAQNNLWISAEVTVSDEKLHAKGEFPLKQKDYGIKLVSVAGGTLKVKNEVKCSFEITAVKDG